MNGQGCQRVHTFCPDWGGDIQMQNDSVAQLAERGGQLHTAALLRARNCSKMAPTRLVRPETTSIRRLIAPLEGKIVNNNDR